MVEGDINLLSINQQVAAVCAGQLSTDSDNDILTVGTQTNLLAYNLNNNSDLFYKDVRLSVLFVYTVLLLI